MTYADGNYPQGGGLDECLWWSNAIDNAALVCRRAAQLEANLANSAASERDKMIHSQRANQAKELEDTIRLLKNSIGAK